MSVIRLQPSLAAAILIAGPDDRDTVPLAHARGGQMGRVVVDGVIG